MNIRVKYLRHDNYKTTLQILTTTIDEVIIGPTFVQVSADLHPLRLFYWVYRLAIVSPVKVKSKANLVFC